MKLYGRIREAYGWTHAVIDELDLLELQEIAAHWKDEPPIGAVIRAWVGVRSRVEVANVADTVEDQPTERVTETSAEAFEQLRAAYVADANKHGLRSPWG